MELTRRSFLGTGSIAASLGVVGLAQAPKLAPIDDTVPAPPPALPIASDSEVVVLGDELDSDFGKFIRQLSDDVFRRLSAEFPPVRLSIAKKLGEGEPIGSDEDVTDGWRQHRTIYRSLAQQWNTGIEIPSMFVMAHHQPHFDLERFRDQTSHWELGAALSIGGRVPTKEAFANAKIVGLPELPRGLIWCAHYLDTKSGAAMRVLADHFSIVSDTITVRYDVMIG